MQAGVTGQAGLPLHSSFAALAMLDILAFPSHGHLQAEQLMVPV